MNRFDQLEHITRRNKELICRGALLIFALVLVGSVTIRAQDDDYYTVKGRVVDQKGNAFPHAGICLEPIVYESEAFDRFIECIGTDSDGQFAIKKIKDEYTIGKAYFLFVSVDKVDGLSTIIAPFDEVRRFDKSFNGKLVRFGSQNVIDLGDVGIQFRFGKAVLSFSQGGFPASKKQVDWPNAWLRILNRDGNIAYFGTLSKEDVRYVRGNGSRLDLALPEGKWKVEILDSYNAKRPLAYSTFFDVKRESEVNVPMKLSR